MYFVILESISETFGVKLTTKSLRAILFTFQWQEEGHQSGVVKLVGGENLGRIK